MKNYSSTYAQAVEQLNNIFTHGVFEIGQFGASQTKVSIKSYNVAPLNMVEVEQALWSTLEMNVQYSYPTVASVGGIQTIKVDKKFFLFCPEGDNNIPYTAQKSIWGTVMCKFFIVNKPDTVAVDNDGNIYLVYFSGEKMTFKKCGVMDRDKVEQLNLCNVYVPYSFDIDKSVLYDLIAGEIGWKYIREHLKLVFIYDSGEPIAEVEVNVEKEFDGAVC